MVLPSTTKTWSSYRIAKLRTDKTSQTRTWWICLTATTTGRFVFTISRLNPNALTTLWLGCRHHWHHSRSIPTSSTALEVTTSQIQQSAQILAIYWSNETTISAQVNSKPISKLFLRKQNNRCLRLLNLINFLRMRPSWKKQKWILLSKYWDHCHKEYLQTQMINSCVILWTTETKKVSPAHKATLRSGFRGDKRCRPCHLYKVL